MKVLVEHFDEVVNRLEITQVVIVHVHANAKVEASVAAIDDFEVSELKKTKYCGWMRKSLEFQDKIHLDPLHTSTKFVCFASRTVTTA